MSQTDQDAVPQMISSRFELFLAATHGDVLEHVRRRGDVHWVATTQDGWEFGVSFPDYEAARWFFASLKDYPAKVNVRWMVKGQPSTIEHHGHQDRFICPTR